MDIATLSGLTTDRVSTIYGTDISKISTGSSDDSSTFDSIYKAAVNMITSTNDYLQEAQQAEVDYATGELTSTHELAVIEQKANLSLQYTVAVKNQLLSAYKELMNMQI